MLAKVTSLGQKLKTAAGDSEIPVLDFYRLFMDDGGRVRSNLFLDDGVHANRQGHRVMAELAASQIGDLFLLKT